MCPTFASPIGIATTPFALKTRQVVALVNELRSSGAQAEIDIPKIVVLGNQSAGKSSLVEAFTGIQVPRSAGTCTRCPMECRLTNKDVPWQCQIKIRRERDGKGRQIEGSIEVPFGPLIRERDRLKIMILRAASAVRNPSVPSKRFVEATLEEITTEEPPLGSSHQLPFSPDVIILEIVSSDVPDLVFIDLPGIIANVAPGVDKACIELIRDLAKKYIQGNTLILLAITMKEDIDLQSAALLANEADPTGTRTLGVLTKADTVEEGDEQQWFDILEGRKYKLKHGYYITKQPSQQELNQNISFQDARANEASFFATSVWRKASPTVINRTGVLKLTDNLGILLTKLVQEALPDLRQDAKDALDEVNKELLALPDPPSDRPVEDLLRIIRSFVAHVHRYMEGLEGCESLIHNCKDGYSEFKARLSSTVPLFYPFQAKRTEDGKEHQFLAFPAEDDHVQQEAIGGQVSMDVVEMRGHLKRSITRELPRNIPFSAKAALYRACSKPWDRFAGACFDQVRASVQECLLQLVAEYFGDYTNTPLRDKVIAIVEEQLLGSYKNASNYVKMVMALEKRSFTMNESQYHSLTERYLTQYKAHKSDFATAYYEELSVMAEVQAYFRISYKRVIDNVPSAIDHGFLTSLSDNLEVALQSGLGLNGLESAKRAAMYLAEDPEITATRDELSARKMRLEGIIAKLYNF